MVFPDVGHKDSIPCSVYICTAKGSTCKFCIYPGLLKNPVSYSEYFLSYHQFHDNIVMKPRTPFELRGYSFENIPCDAFRNVPSHELFS